MTDSYSSHSKNRRLPLNGAVNFRDIGGYQTMDQRLVKTGLVYRSDHLSRLDANDHQLLIELNFKTVCDLRSLREQERSPDLLPPNDTIRLLSLPIQAKFFDPATAMKRLHSGDDSWLTIDFLCRLYLNYVDDFGLVWGKLLRLIASAENLPLVFHCTGGKDRTGIFAALLLKFLGVEEELIFSDHDLSNTYNAERLRPFYAKFEDLGIGPEKAATYLQAPPEPLAAMFAHLKKRYGTVEDYLRTEANLDSITLKALQTILLQ
jgi:protein-tyrosine phosphatase